MKAKPVVPREQAGRDVDEAIAHYLAKQAAGDQTGQQEVAQFNLTLVGVTAWTDQFCRFQDRA